MTCLVVTPIPVSMVTEAHTFGGHAKIVTEDFGDQMLDSIVRIGAIVRTILLAVAFGMMGVYFSLRTGRYLVSVGNS